VFTDPQNQVIFVTKNYGKKIMKIELSFTPSEVSFHDDEPLTFLLYDKVNSTKQVNLSYFYNSSLAFVYPSVINLNEGLYK
jgi:hypothetical protein